jgi:hypothetical protein
VLLQVHTRSLHSVVNLFSDGEEMRGFVWLSSQINIQYSRVLDSLHANTFNKICIDWKPTFHNATIGTTVCSMFPCFLLLPPSCLYFLPSHSTCEWCTLQLPNLLKDTISITFVVFRRCADKVSCFINFGTKWS